MDIKTHLSKAADGYSLLSKRHISKGSLHTRIQTGIGSMYDMRARTTAPSLLDFRWTKINDNLWVNNGSAKKRLGLTNKNAILRALDSFSAVNLARKHNEKKLFMIEKTRYIPMWKEEKLQALYKLTTQLGEGAFGSVWSATDILSGEKRAIKKFIDKKEGKIEAKAYEMMGQKDEVELHKQSGSLIMEKMDGDLFHALNKGVFDDSQKRTILAEVWRQLSEIHNAGIVHRDIKLDNILYKFEKDKTIKIQIADPGFAVWEKNPITELKGTAAVLKQRDVNTFLKQENTVNAETKIAAARGMEIFSLAIESMHFVIGRIANTSKQIPCHDGSAPCKSKEFIQKLGLGKKKGLKVWNHLNVLRNASLSDRSKSGISKKAYTELSKLLIPTA